MEIRCIILYYLLYYLILPLFAHTDVQFVNVSKCYEAEIT